MQSTVHLFNTALARLGGEQLALNTSSQEGNTLGQICENLFPHVLEMTLTAHAWSFAIRRKTLASPLLNELDGDGDASPDYPHVFSLPADCLRPLHLEGHVGVGPSPAYVLEGRTLRCRYSPAVLVYVARIRDPKRWPPLFADALAWGLAAELASAQNNDPQKQRWCLQNQRMVMADAVAVDQGAQNPVRAHSAWAAARFSGE